MANVLAPPKLYTLPECHLGEHQAPCDICGSHEKMQQRILEAEAALKTLKEAQRAIPSKINQKHDPLHAIPSEIVSRIFELIPDISSPSPQQSFKLGTICHLWRQVAWSTPLIWTKLDFILNPDKEQWADTQVGGRRYMRRLKILEDCITRSGSLPLELCICPDGDFKVLDLKGIQIDRLMSLVKRPDVLSRLVDFYLEVPASAFMHFQAVEAPLLKSLVLETPRNGPRIFPSPLNLVHFTTNVEQLIMHAMDQDRISVSSENVRVAELTSCSPASCIMIMRRAPLLKSCTLELSTGPIPLAVGASPAVLGHLTNLSIYYEGPDGLGDFFDHFTLPALQRLDFGGPKLLPFNHRQFLSFVKRSRCPLSTLLLPETSTPWTVMDVHTLLGFLPNLSTLDLYNVVDSLSLAVLFRTVFAPPESLDTRPVIKTFSCQHTWKWMDGFQKWSFIPELFERDRAVSRNISIDLNIPGSDMAADKMFMPLNVVQVIQTLQSKGWGFHVRGHTTDGEEKTDLFEASILHHETSRIST